MIDQFKFFLIFFPSLLFSLSFHESAHAWVASKFGDETAKRLGRITLNPLPHIDLLGTIIFPLVLFFTPGIHVPIGGWAKPVPVTLANLRDPRKDNLWIAFAGPLSNFTLAVVCAILFRAMVFGLHWVDLSQVSETSFAGASINGVSQILAMSIYVNLGLGIFNLIPLHPLDGGKVVEGLLPQAYVESYNRIAAYGMILIFLLYYTVGFGFISRIVTSMARWLSPGVSF